MQDNIFEQFDLVEIKKNNETICFQSTSKKVISEVSLKIIVNNMEVASLLCLNQCHEDLALGFLFHEGVIDSYEDIQKIQYFDRMQSVVVTLKEEKQVYLQESLRSVTTGCGRCVTYINPLKHNRFVKLDAEKTFSAEAILQSMQYFIRKSEIFKAIGSVHSALFMAPGFELLREDIGRHNCFDKISGVLLKKRELERAAEAALFVSGRISSDIIAKVIRLGVPVLVSRSTPTTAAVKLAMEYNVTLLGYVRGDSGFIYSCPERMI